MNSGICPVTFCDWMREVDYLSYQRFGLSIHDLPELPFRDAFESDLSPEEFMDQEDASLHRLLD